MPSSPCRDVEFNNDLENLLNKYNIDLYTSVPNFILSKGVLNYIESISILVSETRTWGGYIDASAKRDIPHNNMITHSEQLVLGV